MRDIETGTLEYRDIPRYQSLLFSREGVVRELSILFIEGDLGVVHF